MIRSWGPGAMEGWRVASWIRGSSSTSPTASTWCAIPSPFFIAAAERRLAARAPQARIALIRLDGADFEPDEPHRVALASCIGASWIFGGHGATLDALIGMIEPGGWVLAGEPYWLKEPSDEYLQASGLKRDSLGSHLENAEAGEKRGLDLVHTLVSAPDDWDRYEGLRWHAADALARAHPNDPDLPELSERVAKEKTAYLKWGRDTVGGLSTCSGSIPPLLSSLPLPERSARDGHPDPVGALRRPRRAGLLPSTRERAMGRGLPTIRERVV